MKLSEKLRNIWYAATHANQLVEEVRECRSKILEQSEEIERLQVQINAQGVVAQDQESNSYGTEHPDETQPAITPARDLPEGWRWVDYDDGSGSLHSPNDKHYFIYDRQPYSEENGIEFRETYSDHWGPFWGPMPEFKAHAESVIRNEYLQQESPLPTAETAMSLDARSAEPDVPDWEPEL